MCRFIAYLGTDLLASALITEPEHSLIHQSFDAHLMSRVMNADGFGFGWYNHKLDSEPGLFTSISPAWSEANLSRLAKKIESKCIFAHVRDATPGMPINQQNCHPFQKGRYLWMHNGKMIGFPAIFRKLRSQLTDDLYYGIKGSTDSEHAFASFLNHLNEDLRVETVDNLVKAIKKTIESLNAYTTEAGTIGQSQYNFAVTDGEKLLVTRYSDSNETPAPSLFLSKGRTFKCEDGICSFSENGGKAESVVIASEPLTEDSDQWEEIPPKTLAVVDKDKNVTYQQLPLP